MTIQIPNPGTGNGATGDNEFVLWSKVKDNFNDSTHAASKLVGNSTGQIPLMTAFGIGNTGWGASTADTVNTTSTNSINNIAVSGLMRVSATDALNQGAPIAESGTIMSLRYYDSYVSQVFYTLSSAKPRMFLRNVTSAYVGNWFEIYNTASTTTDSNGFIKKASPIIKVYPHKIELNADAETQDVTFVRNGIGDYTVNTVSGLSTDGWYLELPKDLNGNPKVAVTLEETNGVISLKSYKRIFSMDTFTFVPDLDEPLDIPEGRWIDLRLNEIETPEILPEV